MRIASVAVAEPHAFGPPLESPSPLDARASLVPQPCCLWYSTTIPKPKHLEAEFADRFRDLSVAEAYVSYPPLAASEISR